MNRIHKRAGFALPMTIMVTVVLSAALTAAFLATASETTTNTSIRGQSRAFMVAQMALERFLEAPDPMTTCPKCDTLRTTPLVEAYAKAVGTDSAYITVTRIRHQSGTAIPAVYFIQARGVDKRFKLGGKLAAVDAERSVGLFAQWNTNTMQVVSAWTSLTGLRKTGTAGLLSGVDECGEMPTIAGTTVGKGDLATEGGSGWATGNPPVDTSKTSAELAASIKVDWNGIINGNTIAADFTVPTNAFPEAGWFVADTSRWPIIRIKTPNFILPHKGRGLLIVEGDLTIGGSNMWDGIILVGGKLTSNGSNTVAGAVITGLNSLLPGAPPIDDSVLDDSQANGQKTYVYSSCKVARASKSLERFRVLANTWADNLPSW
jgi:hypothetical protein